MSDGMVRELTTNATTSTCIVSGGEPILRLAPEEQTGHGGRNQQLALRALKILVEEFPGFIDSNDFCLLSAGTDRQDGNTTAAGAWCDQETYQAAIAKTLSMDDYLRCNDAGTFFQLTAC